MIVQNFLVGYDRLGTELHCGDICKMDVTTKDQCEKLETKEYVGMIVYDMLEMAFALAPLHSDEILLSKSDYQTLERLYAFSNVRFNHIFSGNAWKELYNKHLVILE